MGNYFLLAGLAVTVTAGAAFSKEATRRIAVMILVVGVFLLWLSCSVVPAASIHALPVPVPAETEQETTAAPAVAPRDTGYFVLIELILEDLAEGMFTLSAFERAGVSAACAVESEAALREASRTIKGAAAEAYRIGVLPAVAEAGHEAFLNAMQNYYYAMHYLELGLDALILDSGTASAVFFDLAMKYLGGGGVFLQQAFARWKFV